MSHQLKSLAKKAGVVGAPGLPQASKINACDKNLAAKNPAKPLENLRRCRTCGVWMDAARGCPAFCDAVLPQKPKPYTGPDWIGSSHVGRLGAPVR